MKLMALLGAFAISRAAALIPCNGGCPSNPDYTGPANTGYCQNAVPADAQYYRPDIIPPGSGIKPTCHYLGKPGDTGFKGYQSVMVYPSYGCTIVMSPDSTCTHPGVTYHSQTPNPNTFDMCLEFTWDGAPPKNTVSSWTYTCPSAYAAEAHPGPPSKRSHRRLQAPASPIVVKAE